LDPGAKVEPVMPGWFWSESVSVAPGLAIICSDGTTVTGTKVSSTNTPDDGAGDGVSVGATGAGALGAALRFATGLGVVTTIPGS
jgi:hypothetical protein